VKSAAVKSAAVKSAAVKSAAATDFTGPVKSRWSGLMALNRESHDFQIWLAELKALRSGCQLFCKSDIVRALA
jgi:hypothetical protein